MRASAFLSLTLGLGLLLGACDSGDDDEHEEEGSCTDAQQMRVDDILGLVGDDTTGATVFSTTCGVSSCHGADGDSGPAENLSEHVAHYDANALGCLLLNGVEAMPSQASLSDQELADVIAYVEATF